MPEQQQIVAVGPREEILGLKSAGVQILPADDASAAEDLLREHAESNETKLILLSESIARELEQLVREVRTEERTLVLLIPSHRGAEGMTKEWIKRAMEQTIGVDVISDNK
jgi:V/A-type H+-transporting ATPase subunit F